MSTDVYADDDCNLSPIVVPKVSEMEGLSSVLVEMDPFSADGKRIPVLVRVTSAESRRPFSCPQPLVVVLDSPRSS